MELRFNPLDPLFFRNGRPFTAGEETWADSIFPPNPSVLYGALRTALATVTGKETSFVDVNTRFGPNIAKVLRLYYLLDGISYYSLPLDYAYNKDKPQELQKLEKANKEYGLNLSKAINRKSIVSPEKNQGLKLVFNSFDRSTTFEDGIIAESALLHYLNNEAREISSKRLRDYVCEEPKVGIGRDDASHSVDEGLLYRVGMQRLKGLQLGMTIDPIEGFNANDFNHRQVRLGGEGKIAEINSVSASSFHFDVKEVILKPGYFKLYFATPAIINNESLMPLLGISATLMGAIIGKSISIGGYDMVENKPKTMYKAIPAGSVFYYQTDESPEALSALQGKSFSDVRKEEGFGIAYLGNFTPTTK